MKPSALMRERPALRRALDWVVRDLQGYIKADPKEYIEAGCDEPSIDVRLCVDDDGWIFRTGLVDYDPYHSKACAASCVGSETDTDGLLDDLLTDVLDQLHDRGVE